MAKGGFTGAVPPRETSPEDYSGVWDITEQYGEQKAGSWPFQADDCAPRSLRFNSADSANLSKTLAAAGNRKTWTMSYWVKRAKLNTEQMVFSAASSSSHRVHFYYESNNNIAVSSPSFYYTTNVIARDPGAWQHLVFACDTTQSTDTDRFKIYINSVLVTSFANQSHPAQTVAHATPEPDPVFRPWRLLSTCRLPYGCLAARRSAAVEHASRKTVTYLLQFAW